jgi:nucleoside-diphosphate-sugar epimerase
MLKILITGSKSFIGTNYISNSKFKEVEQISLLENKPDEINFSGIEVVLHLAAIVHQSKKISENEYNKINRDLCLQVATYSKNAGVRQFIFLSTVKVYGEINPLTGPLIESSPCIPVDFYGKSKLEAEIALRRLEDDKFIISIIRTPLVYGAGVKANMFSIMKLTDRIPILPFRNVNNKRCYTFVENLVAYIDRIIERRASGLFIAMDQEPLSTTTLVILISKYLGKKIVLIKAPHVLLKIAHLVVPSIVDRLYSSFEMNNNRTLELLDFKIPYTTEEGIAKMVASYKESKIRNVG